MTNNVHNLSKKQAYICPEKVQLGNGSGMPITHIGSTSITHMGQVCSSLIYSVCLQNMLNIKLVFILKVFGLIMQKNFSF
ncbi:hypothetical protein LR48_Vigan01g167900 [Vigna angularis]|uniref:Uncharacterized protein n=2 Tax=Phaseolus angularis TaxID=3914 RepID=A0A0L9TNF9_PHAAN|nr:hypothetical protein LR48_Vigan01g167900 [Vigna angularis]BAT75285.1 hypothetical protein VIGAN_01312200 [Vigna angularis var. angularis]